MVAKVRGPVEDSCLRECCRKGHAPGAASCEWARVDSWLVLPNEERIGGARLHEIKGGQS
jgi:hypothetical protein